jgi:hypothetical protein
MKIIFHKEGTLFPRGSNARGQNFRDSRKKVKLSRKKLQNFTVRRPNLFRNADLSWGRLMLFLLAKRIGAAVEGLAVGREGIASESILGEGDSYQMIDWRLFRDPGTFLQFCLGWVAHSHSPSSVSEVGNAIRIITFASSERPGTFVGVVIVLEDSIDAIFFEDGTPFLLDVNGIIFAS